MVSKKKIKISVINLARSQERREHINNKMDFVSLSFDFFEAIDGSNIPKHTFSKVLTTNEIGCALSHYAIYEELISSHDEFRLVLEDDVEFDETLIKFLENLSKLPDDFDVILLGHHPIKTRARACLMSYWRRTKIFDKYVLGFPVEPVCGGYGYLISQKGAMKLVKNKGNIEYPVDHFKYQDKLVDLLIVDPPIISMDTKMSDEYHSMQDREISNAVKRRVRSKSLKAKIIKITKNIGVYGFYILVKNFLLKLRFQS